MTPGLIRNAHSLRNRKRADDLSAAARDWLGPRFVSPDSAESVAAALEGLHGAGVDWLIVDGGDGTVRDVLTLLPDIWTDGLPRLSIVPSGNTNVIAADVGCRDRGPAALARLMAGGLESRTRRCLEILREGAAPLRGMFFGAAGFRRGMEMAHDSPFHDRLWHGPAVALAVAVTFGRAFLGRDEGWLKGERIGLAVDGGAAETRDRFLVLATTLERLVLGLWPFWNETATGGLRYLDVAGRPPHLARALMALARGRVPEWLRASPAYRSGTAGELVLDLPQGFALDGESYAGPGAVTLRAGPALTFLRP